MASQLEEIEVEFAGHYVALDAALRVIASGLSKDDVRLHAAALGCTAPVIIYCSRLKPWILPEADMVKGAVDQLNNVLSRLPDDFTRRRLQRAVYELEQLEATLRSSSRTGEANDIAVRLTSKSDQKEGRDDDEG
jgi:hypothetical protein